MSDYKKTDDDDDDDDDEPPVSMIEKRRRIGAYRDQYVGTRPTIDIDNTPTNTTDYSSGFDKDEINFLRSVFPSARFSENNTQYQIPNNYENKQRSFLPDQEYYKVSSEDYNPTVNPTTIVKNLRPILKKKSSSLAGLGGKKRKRTTKRRKNSSKRGKRKQKTLRRKK
jgi:hypothetical protein